MIAKGPCRKARAFLHGEGGVGNISTPRRDTRRTHIAVHALVGIWPPAISRHVRAPSPQSPSDPTQRSLAQPGVSTKRLAMLWHLPDGAFRQCPVGLLPGDILRSVGRSVSAPAMPGMRTCACRSVRSCPLSLRLPVCPGCIPAQPPLTSQCKRAAPEGAALRRKQKVRA